MKAVFKARLSEQENSLITGFCRSVRYCAIEQSIGFPALLNEQKITYFYLEHEGSIKSFCQISEKLRFASVWFGPVCDDRDVMLKSLCEIIDHYKKRRFWYLGIQLYLKSGYDSEYIDYALNRLYRIRYKFNNENTKASLEIDLDRSISDIYRDMRKGHKSDIQKALRSGMYIEEAQSEGDVKAFTDIYHKMTRTRKIHGHTSTEIKEIFNYVHDNGLGTLLLAKDSNKLVVGGAIIVKQGISARYLISASDPEKRDLPMTHLVIYKAIEMAKKERLRYFDFWGFNHFAIKDDQIYNVNLFKKGFGGYYTFFAKKMNIDLIPNGYNIHRFFSVIKKTKDRLGVSKYNL